MIIGIDASRAFIKQRTGTENYSSHLIQQLIEIDPKNQYVLYSRETPRRWPNGLLRGEIRVIPWRRLWTQAGLALECLLHPPDILFIPAHTMPIMRRPLLKTIITIHGLEYEYLPQYYQFPQRLYLNKSTEYAVRHATHLIAVSQWTKKQLVERLGTDPKKISVIYEGVSLNPAVPPSEVDEGVNKPQTPARCANALLGGEIADYALFVGTIQPRKNLGRLIEAFATLTRCNLVIAGKPGWMDKEVYEAPKKFRVEKRVKFLGYVSDKKLASLYANALFFVLPSLCEGFGLPVLEAMSFGCPVIASKTGALPEIIGKAGLLVDPYKTEEIARAMKLMIENQELREGLREKGLARCRQFSWQKAAQETIKVFEKVYES